MCDFVRVRRTLYVRGNRACIQEALSAKLPANKWLMAPVAFWAYVSPGTVQELSTVRGVVAGFTRSKRKFENAGQTTYQGHAVVALRATGPSSETLYVAASGTPYPVAVVRGGSALPETVTFDGWNAPLSLKAPKGAILPPPPSG